MNEQGSVSNVPWWKRPELLLLLIVCAAAVWWRPTALPLVGEETRRGRYGWHMVHGGDWAAVPRGLEAFYDRPPGQHWQIAGAYLLTGRLDTLTVRLGSLVATTLTAVMIFAYGSGALSRVNACSVCSPR